MLFVGRSSNFVYKIVVEKKLDYGFYSFDQLSHISMPDLHSNEHLALANNCKRYFSENHDVSYDYLLDLDVSAPMRTIEDLKKGFDILNSNIYAKNLFSVSDASKNPYFNMVEKNKEGFYTLSKTSKNVLSRQLAPKVFEMNASFYFYKRDFFNQKVIYLFNNSLIYKMEHESFDLDHLIDFDFLDFLISNNKLTFSI